LRWQHRKSLLTFATAKEKKEMSAANGRFVWFDLLTTDLPAAKAFYSEVIGWQSSQWSGGNYEVWVTGSDQVGGMMGLSADSRTGNRPHWLGYVGTDRADPTLERAQKMR
jgi:predicted enzyme related to lactoylglutathione lyase